MKHYTPQHKLLTLDLARSSLDNLDKSNRWVQMGDHLPWADIEKEYNSSLGNKENGAGNKPARMIVGAMIVKHKLGLSDQETIDIIRENPYVQYPCGLSEFTDTQDRKHKGILKIDSTCANAEVCYPVNATFLETFCRKIDEYTSKACKELGIKGKKTHNKDALRVYLLLIKQKVKKGCLVKDTIVYLLKIKCGHSCGYVCLPVLATRD
jgi:hypothetical protein